MNGEYDVIVVGGSIAGCTAAVLYGRRGLKVAVVERNTELEAYKKVCTHFIQPSAVPTLQRMGLAERIEAVGAVRSRGHLWTKWGWNRLPQEGTPEHPSYGYNIRRQKLDPILRQMAQETPGVELLLGHSVQGLVRDEGGKVIGAEISAAGGVARTVRAKLVVGADGRNSKVAQLAGFETEVKPHNRFGYLAYYRNLPLKSGSNAQLWLLDPDCAYAFPNDDGLTLVANFVHKDRLPEFKKDLEGSFVKMFEKLPDGPDLSRGERVSDFFGMIDMPNMYRKPDGNGVTLIGDAALASDPLWGVGCGWALLSAEWLVEATAEAIVQNASLTAPLAAYRERHHRTLYPLHAANAEYSLGKTFDAKRALVFSASPHVPEIQALVAKQLSLEITLPQFAAGAVPRALWFHFKRRIGLGPDREARAAVHAVA